MISNAIPKQFAVQTFVRAGLLFLTMLLLSVAIVREMPVSILVLLGLLVVYLFFNLLGYQRRTLKDLYAFLYGLRFGDYQRGFSIAALGAPFAELESALKVTVDRLRSLRSDKEIQAQYYQALVQHIPIPFLVVYADQRIELLNNATRRAFNVADISHARQLADFGAAFQRDVLQIKPGETLLSSVWLEGNETVFILNATEVVMQGQKRKLLTMQNVQGQLDARELLTWQNLLRVTSHEILNSLAPVTSCAETAKNLTSDLMRQELDAGHRAELEDINDAIATVVRRSEGLSRFVQSYRQLTRMPPPEIKSIYLAEYFQRLRSLLVSELEKKGIQLEVDLQASNIQVSADEDMLDQALINLIRNATDALGDTDQARIIIRGRRDNLQRLVLEIIDNGPGVDKEQASKIFVPFYTTKQEGSGVGLALVRYIMLSHGGLVSHHNNESGGSTFRLIFA